MQQSLRIPVLQPWDQLKDRGWIENGKYREQEYGLRMLEVKTIQKQLHTTKPNGSSGYTTAVHSILPVRLSSVLRNKNTHMEQWENATRAPLGTIRNVKLFSIVW